ncbi:hypothetical protein ACVISU_007265 [Bradyrhizobium sp. USDA 4452]
MITISLALVSVGLFGAHIWDHYKNGSPVVVRISSTRR